MKIALSESKIFGPAIPRYMKVPYETPGQDEEMPAPLPDDARTADLRRAASMALNGGRRALMHRMDAEDEALFHSGLDNVPRENTDDSFNTQMPYRNIPQGAAPSMPTPERDVDSDRATPAQLEAGRVRIQSPEPIRPRPQQQEHQQRGRQDFEMRRI